MPLQFLFVVLLCVFVPWISFIFYISRRKEPPDETHKKSIRICWIVLITYTIVFGILQIAFFKKQEQSERTFIEKCFEKPKEKVIIALKEQEFAELSKKEKASLIQSKVTKDTILFQINFSDTKKAIRFDNVKEKGLLNGRYGNKEDIKNATYTTKDYATLKQCDIVNNLFICKAIPSVEAANEYLQTKIEESPYAIYFGDSSIAYIDIKDEPKLIIKLPKLAKKKQEQFEIFTNEICNDSEIIRLLGTEIKSKTIIYGH